MLESSFIKAEALRLGFFRCGISKADRVNKETEEKYLEWIGRGLNASMNYLSKNIEKRLDPRILVPGVKSIISVAINYAPNIKFPENELHLSSYAIGTDYHLVVKDKLKKLAEAIGVNDYRAFCDSAPIIEKYWAEQSGIGWIGRNKQLIIPKSGSMFFLGELFVMEEVSCYDSTGKNHCGTCNKCIEACPTSCLYNDYFDSERCLSYQTIENREKIDGSFIDKIGNTIYGCDICINACPWNKFSEPTKIEDFYPSKELIEMKFEDWEKLSVEKYKKLFKNSAVKRVKYEGLMRNIEIASKKRRK